MSGFPVKKITGTRELTESARMAWKTSMPLKLQLLEPNGANASAPDIVVNAMSLMQKDSTAASVLAADGGNANPDNNFRYDAMLGGYIYNLSTKNLGTGTWVLRFTATDDPSLHTVTFDVK